MFRKLNKEMKMYLLYFLVATLGGAIRKWVTDSGVLSNMILLFQMVIPFIMYMRRSPNTNSPFQKFGILYAYFAYMAFHIIYPLQLTLYHGMIGMIVHGAFWLLMFFYLANRHIFQPTLIMRVFLVIGITEVVLGFVQYALPTDNFLNRYANMEIISNIATVGDKVRITGTFSFLSGYTAYLLFVVFLIWAFIRLKYPAWMVVTAAACCMITGFMTGSRTATAMNLIFLIPLFIQEYSLKNVVTMALRLLIPGAIAVSVILLNKEIPLGRQITTAYDNFMLRVETNRESGEESNRLGTDLWYLQNGRYKHPLFGVGLGSTYQGATIMFGTSQYVQEFGYVETEFSRVLLEGGFVIIFFKLILSLMLVMNLAITGIMRWIVFCTIYFFNPIVFNVHNAAFVALGIILVDNIIWRQKIERIEEERKQLAELEERKEHMRKVAGNVSVENN